MTTKGLSSYEIKNNIIISLDNNVIKTKYKKGKCGKKIDFRKVCSATKK
jgi:hypothetical protein